LLDFGLAKGMTSFTGGTNAGTLNYQAPEFHKLEKIK